MIDKIFLFLNFALEGKYIICITVIISAILGFIFPRSLFFTIIILAILLIFFRNPQRKVICDNFDILSPAEGTVADIEDVALPEYNNAIFKRIGIFLSVFDVHVQRIPFSGEVILIKYKPGKHYAAFKKDVVGENEANLVLISTKNGVIGVKQISGLLARRVRCKLKVNDQVKQGDHLGIILLGSRVEIYLPNNTEILVNLKDKVKVGKTIVACFKK